MNIYIAELAGKDSVAAIHKFIRTHENIRIIPSIVYTRTEYGGFDSYFESLKFLKNMLLNVELSLKRYLNFQMKNSGIYFV